MSDGHRRPGADAPQDGAMEDEDGPGFSFVLALPPRPFHERLREGTSLSLPGGWFGSWTPDLDPNPLTERPPGLGDGLLAALAEGPPSESSAQIGAYLRSAERVRLTARATHALARAHADHMDFVERALDRIALDGPLFVEFPEPPRRAEVAAERAAMEEWAAREQGNEPAAKGGSWRRDASEVMDVGYLFVPDPMVEGRVVVVPCWRHVPGDETYGYAGFAWYGPDLVRLAALSRDRLSKDSADAHRRLSTVLEVTMSDEARAELAGYAEDSGWELDTRHEERIVTSAKLDATSESMFALAFLVAYAGPEATFYEGVSGETVMDLPYPLYARRGPGPFARAAAAVAAGAGRVGGLVKGALGGPRQATPSDNPPNGS